MILQSLGEGGNTTLHYKSKDKRDTHEIGLGEELRDGSWGKGRKRRS